MQRWKASFSREEEIKYISHLDLMRALTRTLRRAGIPLAYSQGFTPHPRISFAVPLAVGITSEGELMEMLTGDGLLSDQVLAKIRPQLPAGLRIISVEGTPLDSPSLASRVSSVEYRAEVASRLLHPEIQHRIDNLLAAKSWPRQREREGKIRHYDLRPLVEAVNTEKWDQRKIIHMRLRVSQQGTGRPGEVLTALGLVPRTIHRLRLNLASW